MYLPKYVVQLNLYCAAHGHAHTWAVTVLVSGGGIPGFKALFTMFISNSCHDSDIQQNVRS